MIISFSPELSLHWEVSFPSFCARTINQFWVLMSDLITSYQLWTGIDAILLIQRTGIKTPTISPLSFCNPWITEKSFCAENANSLLTPLHTSHSLQTFTPACLSHVALWLLLSFVLYLFHCSFFHSDLEPFFHMIGCAAQLYQSAVLSLSILKGSFIPLTELEKVFLVVDFPCQKLQHSTTQMKQKFAFWLFKNNLKIAIPDWKISFLVTCNTFPFQIHSQTKGLSRTSCGVKTSDVLSVGEVFFDEIKSAAVFQFFFVLAVMKFQIVRFRSVGFIGMQANNHRFWFWGRHHQICLEFVILLW